MRRYRKMFSGAFLGILIVFSGGRPAHGNPVPAAVSRLAVEEIGSLKDMGTALSVLASEAAAAREAGRFTFALQDALLEKSGAGISRIAFLMAPGGAGGADKKRAGRLLGDIRELIQDISARNKKAISELQEHHLDKMADPFAFFQSDAWRKPHRLVSLAAYWLGWNGYYTSLLLGEGDPGKREVLAAAIEEFSRAFIEFKEDAIVAKSLFGRGLCYKEIKAYGRAAHDFQLVREKAEKSDIIYLRSGVEGATLHYLSGNPGQALKALDAAWGDFPGADIPEGIRGGVDRLRAKILLAMLGKGKPRGQSAAGPLDKTFQQNFKQLKTLAGKNRGMAGEYYRYVQTHARELLSLSFEDLGPVGAVAIGDFFFDEKKYTEALAYYLHLNAGGAASTPDDLKDHVLLRLAYVYCRQQQWREALGFLETRADKYPDAGSAAEAARLYYLAAVKVRRAGATDRTYARYIKAVKYYLARCGGCPDRSDAHFQLGKYYQKKGASGKAMGEYARVKDDSPNFGYAKYYLVRDRVERLDALGKQGRDPAETVAELYRDGVGHARAYEAGQGNSGAVTLPEEQAAHMAVVVARLYGYGPKSDLARSLGLLDGFEERFPAAPRLAMQATRQRVYCYQRLGRFEDAEKEIRRFAGISPIDSRRYAFIQALANQYYTEYIQLGGIKENRLAAHHAAMALALYQKLYHAALSNPAYQADLDATALRLARIHMGTAGLTEARAMYQAILGRNPHSADAVYNLAAIHEKTGQWKEALAYWRRFSDGVKTGTQHWYESRYRTARALVELGRRDKACTIVKMTTVLHPDMGNEELNQKFRRLHARTCDTP